MSKNIHILLNRFSHLGINYVPRTRNCLFGNSLIAVPVRGVKQIILHKDIIQKEKQDAEQERAHEEELHREEYSKERVEEILRQQEHSLLKKKIASYEQSDMPIPGLVSPYAKPAAKCLLCQYEVQLDYKNVRLLSQFVSPHTGRIYDRDVTGMCIYMHSRLSKLIKRARYFGFMPYVMKEPEYLRDPKLFDPFRRK